MKLIGWEIWDELRKGLLYTVHNYSVEFIATNIGDNPQLSALKGDRANAWQTSLSMATSHVAMCHLQIQWQHASEYQLQGNHSRKDTCPFLWLAGFPEAAGGPQREMRCWVWWIPGLNHQDFSYGLMFTRGQVKSSPPPAMVTKPQLGFLWLTLVK